MNVGQAIQKIRKEQNLTQEAFGRMLHVTRQAVSNWETGKTYPDLQILVEISNRFGISLDALLKEDAKMVQTMDRERMVGVFRRQQGRIDAFTGAGTGVVVSCLFSPDSVRRSILIAIGLLLICVGWYKKAKHDRRMLSYLERVE